jgi:hypothetical protein
VLGGSDDRPADDRGADGAPACVCLVDVGGHLGLLGGCEPGRVDLRVGDVADDRVGGRFRAELLADHAEDGVAHLDQVTFTAQAIGVVAGVDAKKSVVTIPEAAASAVVICGGRLLSFGRNPALAANSCWAVLKLPAGASAVEAYALPLSCLNWRSQSKLTKRLTIMSPTSTEPEA